MTGTALAASVHPTSRGSSPSLARGNPSMFGTAVTPSAGALWARIPDTVTDVTHGIGFTKACSGPTKVGDPYICTFTVRNVLDDAQDTLTISGLTDVVHTAGGPVTYATVLDDAPVAPSGGATCTAPPGRVCTLPFGGGVSVGPFAHYTVQGADFVGANPLTDDASLQWNDLCNDPTGTGNTTCNPNPPNVGAASSSDLVRRATNTATQIHDPAHNAVTIVGTGSIVHDFVSVTSPDPSTVQLFPSGTAIVDFFTNGSCLGAAAATSVPFPLDAVGQVDATSFLQGPLTAGFYGFLAHYQGDSTYAPSSGVCEPLRVVDANIQLTPLRATNPVGTPHTLTCHINVNDGSGEVNSPAGTVCTVSIVSGPGSPSSQACLTGVTGSCQVVISSAVTGQTEIEASTDVTVAGLVLHRETGDGHPGDGPNAEKRWVNARIHITPSATNRVGQPHTFTVLLEKDLGNGVFVPAAGEHVDVTLTDALGASHTAPAGSCTNAGANTDASGQCTITFTSSSTGTVTGHASSTLSINGSPPFTVQTDGVAPDGPDAVKTFVNAAISIAPSATNEIGHLHTFTVTLVKDAGDGTGFHTAPGETVQVTLTGHDGAAAIPAGPFTLTTDATGQAQVTFTSLAAGSVSGHASSTLSVAGSAPFTVETDGTGSNSVDATKTFVDARISITPNGTDPVNTPHTFTAHVDVNDGSGAGFVDAPSGTQISFSIDSGPGSFTTANPCTVAAGGSCQITMTSAVTGVSTVSAHVALSVGGVPLTRSTDGTAGNSGPATEVWTGGDANIQISPLRATNAVGANHVLTITVNAIGGTIDAGGGTATASIVSGPGTFVGSPTCSYAGGGTTASCQVTITSASVGTTVVQATSNIPVGGVSISRTTGTAANTASGGSGNASKTWVDANIRIGPATAANWIGANHVLTITVGALGGTIDSGPHTATASIVSGPGAFVGSPTCTYTGGGAFASCTVTITSASPGQTVVSAASNVPVGGVSIPRDTNNNAGPGGSGNATKNWEDAHIQLAPATATNPVGTSHTLHCHIDVNDGSGGGYANAPDGTTCTVTIILGPGTPVAQNCTTAGGTGTCDVTIASSAAGTTTLEASTTLIVGGQSRIFNSAPATKTWVDANIQISPLRATNAVGANHVLTITVNALGGTIDPGPHTASASILSGPGAFVGPPTCTYTGGAATASCTVTITSATVGTTVVQATSNIPVNGVVISRTTGTAANTASGGSGNASKIWVDANVQLSPPTATNVVGTNHVLTITVNALGGTIDAAGGTATASIVSGPGHFVGSPTCSYTGGGPFASCTVTISSSVTGTTVVSAASNVPVGGVPVPRDTNGNAGPGGSGNATKTWTDDDLALTGMPSNMTVTATSGAGAVARWPSPTATDEEPGATVSCSPASGSTFPVGLTTVTCTATDSDDTNSPVSATFTVAVVYRITAFFSPAPNSKWKSGQTVPIKIGLTYANGTAIANPDAINLANFCDVTFSATGVQSTPQPRCMKYDTGTHQFIYNWKLGKSPPGPDTLTVTVNYPGPVSNSRSETILIT